MGAPEPSCCLHLVVVEGTTTLDSGLYEIWAGGADYVRRLNTSGTVIAWSGWVEIAYTPSSEKPSATG